MKWPSAADAQGHYGMESSIAPARQPYGDSTGLSHGPAHINGSGSVRPSPDRGRAPKRTTSVGE
jgi:hypothetical protein